MSASVLSKLIAEPRDPYRAGKSIMGYASAIACTSCAKVGEDSIAACTQPSSFDCMEGFIARIGAFDLAGAPGPPCFGNGANFGRLRKDRKLKCGWS